jgi:alpha-beta hydrolase superfamily lysophospholipase
LSAPDGTLLFYRDWSVDRPRAALHIVHGLGEHSGRYAALAHYLNAQRISVRAHDHRGHGRSEGQRGGVGSQRDFVDHLKCVLDDFSREQGKTPFLLGHSLGGLVAAQFMVERLSPIRGLVLSSPALAVRISAFQRLLFHALGRLVPGASFPNGLDVAAISHDAEVVAAYRADPLIHSRVTPGLFRYMLDAMAEVTAAEPDPAVPVLLQVSGADRLVDPEGARRFLNRLAPQRGTLHWYEDAYHEVFNETSERRERVLRDLTDWIDTQLAVSIPPSLCGSDNSQDRGW